MPYISGSINFVASSKEHICLQSQTSESGDQTQKRPSEQKTEESRADRTKGAKLVSHFVSFFSNRSMINVVATVVL